MFKAVLSRKLIVYAILILYGFTPLLWFMPDRNIAGGETTFYMNMDYVGGKDVYMWNDKVNGITCEPGQILFYQPRLLLRQIGFSNETSQRIMWVLIALLIPFSMLYLFRSLGLKEEDALIGGLIAATLYSFNLLHALICQGHLLRFLHSFMPFVVGAYLRGLKASDSRQRIRYGLYIAFFSLGFGPVSTNIPDTLPVIFTCAILTIFYLNKDNYKEIIKFAGLSLLFTLLINSFWIANVYLFFKEFLASYNNAAVAISCSSNEGKLMESFRLLGSWAFKTHVYFPWFTKYYGGSLYLTLFSYFIPIFVFSALLFREKKKEILAFTVITLLAMFIMKGSNPPLGSIYSFLLTNFRFMSWLRSPWVKLGPAIEMTYGLLMGYACLKIFNYFYDHKKKVIAYVFYLWVVISICLVAYPMFTREVNRTQYRPIYSKEPQYWKDLAGWFEKNDELGRVLSFPNVYRSTFYKWEYGMTSAIPMAHFLIPNPTAAWVDEFSTSTRSQFMYNFASAKFTTNKELFNKYMSLLGVRYILQQNDVLYNIPDLVAHNIWSKDKVKKTLGGNKDVIYLGTFGELDLYRMKEDNSIIELR